MSRCSVKQHYVRMEVRLKLNVYVVMTSSDEKPKPLTNTRLAGLDGLGINLVTKKTLLEA